MMGVSAVHCLSSSSWLALPRNLSPLSLTHPSVSPASACTHSNPTAFSSLSFSANLSHNVFSNGFLSMRVPRKPFSPIVCEAIPRKVDSAAKRARQAEKRRLRNKARKSEIRTRMKKALEALEDLKKKSDAQSSDILPIEKLIGEAFSAIDKAVIKGTLHRNTGARRKSRLSRRKKVVEIHHGWYTPAPATVA